MDTGDLPDPDAIDVGDYAEVAPERRLDADHGNLNDDAGHLLADVTEGRITAIVDEDEDED